MRVPIHRAVAGVHSSPTILSSSIRNLLPFGGTLTLCILLMEIVSRHYSSFKDPYAVLGVGKAASTSEIKKAYFDVSH